MFCSLNANRIHFEKKLAESLCQIVNDWLNKLEREADCVTWFFCSALVRYCTP